MTLIKVMPIKVTGKKQRGLHYHVCSDTEEIEYKGAIYCNCGCTTKSKSDEIVDRAKATIRKSSREECIKALLGGNSIMINES